MHSRKTKHYTNQELDQLLLEISSSPLLSELEIKLERPAGGLVRKIQSFSKQYPDKLSHELVLKYEKQYAEQRKSYREKYYQDNRVEILRKRKNYYDNNKKEIKKYHQEYDPKWRQNHRKEIREYHRQHYKDNKGKWKRFGDYLFGLLHIEDKSWREISEGLGVNRSVLSHCLAGNRKPTEKFIRKISERFSIPYKNLQSLLDEI